MRDAFFATPTIGRLAPFMTFDLSDKPHKFRDGIAFFVGSETFANHRSCLDSVFRAKRPTQRPTALSILVDNDS